MKPLVSVLHVLEATEGGTRRWVETLLPRLQSKEQKHSLLCSLKRDPTFDKVIVQFRQLGIDVWTLDMSRDIRLFEDFRGIRFLRRLFHEYPFDVIHSHSSKAGAVTRLAFCFGARPPIVYSPHAFAFLTGGLKGWFYRALERTQVPFTHSVMAVSRSEADEMQCLGYRDKSIELIPNAVGWTDTTPKEASLSNERPLIGFISRFCNQKDPLAFLRACALLQARLPKLRYALYGYGPLESSLREYAQQTGLDIALCTENRGHQMDHVLRELDIYVSTSRYEGLAFSLLDAMAHGKPIVATRVPGNIDVIIDGVNGLLVPPDDPQAVAEAVMRLIVDPSLATRLGRAAQSRVREEFSLETQLSYLSEFYLRVAQSARRWT